MHVEGNILKKKTEEEDGWYEQYQLLTGKAARFNHISYHISYITMDVGDTQNMPSAQFEKDDWKLIREIK